MPTSADLRGHGTGPISSGEPGRSTNKRKMTCASVESQSVGEIPPVPESVDRRCINNSLACLVQTGQTS